MKNRHIIFLIMIVIALCGIVLSVTYALNASVTENSSSEYDLSYTFDISDNATWTINIEAGKTKVYDIAVTNPYSDSIRYGVVYKMDNPTELPDNSVVGVINTTENPSSGSLNANTTNNVSVALVNNSNSNMQVTLGIVSGYKSGGELIIPSGYKIISRTISIPYELPPEEVIMSELDHVIASCSFFGSDILRNEIESIEVIKKSEIPSGVSEPIDISYDKVNHSDQVQLYSIQNSDTSKYKVYIATASGKVSLPKDSKWIFAELSSTTSIDFSKFYTSNVTSMYEIFHLSTGLVNVDLSSWDVSKVTDMSYMFFYCTGLESLNLNGWDTSSVTTMEWMFAQCESLVKVNLNGWNTINVNNMDEMFQNCNSLTSLDLSSFNTSNVTNMQGMFLDCDNLLVLNLSSFDTSNVVKMSDMFNGCISLNFLDLSSFDTSKATDMSGMFLACVKLSIIYVSDKFVTASVTDSTNMFKDCTNLVGGNGTVFDSNNIDVTYARIDKSNTLGYFTNISDKPSSGSNSTPNSPDLVDGLIPVMYNGENWVKADANNANNSWYNYNEKKWANAVLVSETNRSTYRSASNGIVISMDDILAFYVWIPRFKYKVWNINKIIGVKSYNAEIFGVDIVFESGRNSTGTINCTYSYASPSSNAGSPNETCSGSNGEYYTHPAFTFGSDSVRGFWMGKFELTGEDNLTILPNAVPVTSAIGYFSNDIQNMQITGNPYGLNTSKSNTDSHMITNMEWGAVTYLANSKYGRCTNYGCDKVSYNSTTDLTGIGPEDVSEYTYDTYGGVLASTTGNITGIYDMVGGNNEYVMGSASSASNSFVFSQYALESDTGFSTDWYNDSTSKYLTTYAYGMTWNDQTAYNRGRLGDATSEIISSGSTGWYNSSGNFINNDATSFGGVQPDWFMRGGECNYVTNCDVAIFTFDMSESDSAFATRAILVSLK